MGWGDWEWVYKWTLRMLVFTKSKPFDNCVYLLLSVPHTPPLNHNITSKCLSMFLLFLVCKNISLPYLQPKKLVDKGGY